MAKNKISDVVSENNPRYLVDGKEVPADKVSFIDEDGYKWPEGAKPPTHILHKERNYFVIPTKDSNCTHYTHIEVDTSEVDVNLPIKQLTERELSIMKLLLEDVEVKDIPGKLQLARQENIYVFLGRLREKFGVVTNHGLVNKIYRMGFHLELAK